MDTLIIDLTFCVLNIVLDYKIDISQLLYT